ncbi:hypothetical protein ACE7GA_04890 [Roseomonas sp. CCTCC AB2023176]|uniref:hypothetical protein n=1 Tax=Roseomonas sp. CCTCC AB2023176 TaxID=3342640 RepID=UPI0035D6736A
MIIWSGWGILAPLVALLAGVPVLLAGNALLAGIAGGRWLGLSLVLGLLAAAAAVWWVGKRLNDQPGRELIDARTGERLILRPSHRLFFIPMQWWAVPLAALAAVALVASVVNPPAARPDGAKPSAADSRRV